MSEHTNGHPSEFIDINGKQVEIDKDLTPLIRELNKIGIKTQSCCQGDRSEYASITFDVEESMLVVEVEARPDKKTKFTIRWPHKFNLTYYGK